MASTSSSKKTPTQFDDLPPEVLSKILYNVLGINETIGRNVTELEGLRGVSKKLERTAMEEPTLWTSIYRDCTALPQKGCSPDEIPADTIQAEASFLIHKATMDVTHYAKLSGALPLNLSLKLPGRMNGSELAILNLERSIVNRVWRLELTVSGSAAFQFASKNLRDPSPDKPKDISSDAYNSGWPHLESLSLVVDSEQAEDCTVWFMKYGDPGAVYECSLMPRLTNLSLIMPKLPKDWTGINILAVAFPLSQLTSLEIATFSESEWSQFPATIAMVNECRDNLESLTLTFRRSEIPTHESPTLDRILGNDSGITFPKLRKLDLCVLHEESFVTSRDHAGLDQDLSRIFILPYLESLKIIYRGHYKFNQECPRNANQQGGMKVSTLLSLVSRCGDKLRKLFLSNISFKVDSDDLGPDHYTQLLSHKAFSKLEDLTVFDDFLPSFGFLKEKLKDCSFLPDLLCLQLAPGSHLSAGQQNPVAAYSEPGWKIHRTQPPMPSTVSHTKPTTELDDSDPTVATDVEDSGSIAATQVDCAESIPMTKVDCAAQDSMSPTNDVDCSDSIPAKVPAGIDSLPLEVLCQIFRSVVALNDFHVDKMGGLEVLQQVSTELAQAAISEPELWRWIYRDCTEPKPPVLSSNSAVALQEEASLNRKAAMDITHYTKLSGRLPLDLSLKLPSRSHYTELDILDLERSIVDRVWHLELPLSQSAALSLTSKEIRDPCNSDSDYLRGGSSDADVYGWPQLQELRLFFFPEDINFWVWRRRFGRHVGEGVRSSLRLMPRLTSLWLSMPKFPIGVNGSNMIMAAGFPLSQLTRLKLITTEPQQFSASLIMANACRANLEELWLRFNRPISSEIDAHQDPITFPNLKMLELFVCHEETFIASDDEGGLDLDLPRAFKLPSLEDLTIFFGASYEYSKERLKHQQGGMKVSTLLSLVPGNKLRTLYLSNISFEGDNEDLGDDPDDPYTHILSHSAFKNLETLALTDDFLPSFSFLRDKVDDCSFLPHLRDLAPEPGWLLPERQETFDAAYHQKEKFCKRRAQSPKKTAS